MLIHHDTPASCNPRAVGPQWDQYTPQNEVCFSFELCLHQVYFYSNIY